MAYSLATVSPNSWQLQRSSGLAPFSPLSCRAPLLVHCRLRRVGHAIRSSAVAGDAHKGEEEGRKPPRHESWLESESSSTNSYAGWTSTDQTPGGNKLKGYLAAGAVGLILSIGFAFASHSFYPRRGVRDQLLIPLPAEQETILSSDDSKSAVGGHVGDKEQVMPSDVQDQKQNEEMNVYAEDSESKLDQAAGTNQVFLQQEETNDLSLEARADLNVASVTVSIQNDELKETESGPVDVVPVSDPADVEATIAVSRPPVDSTSIAKSENTNAFVVVTESETNSISTSESANDKSSPIAFNSKAKSPFQTTESDRASSVPVSESVVSPIFPNLDAEISVSTTVSQSSSVHSHFDSQDGKESLEERESSVEKSPTIASVSDYGFPSDNAMPGPAIPVEPFIIKNHSSDLPSNVPEMMGEIKQSVSSIEVPFASETTSSTVVTESSVSAIAQNISENGLYKTDDILDVDEVDSIELNSRRTSMFESYLPSQESEHSFISAGIPAPSLPFAALQLVPGKVVVPAVIDHVQGQAFAALQALKVVESGIEPGGLCTRREYARWLIASSAILARNPVSKVFPAMFIENVTELAFDDVTPEDPDFPSIQGLAEAGLISSKLSSRDKSNSVEGGKPTEYIFSPDSPLSRQDLVSWRIALEKRQLPEVNRQTLWEKSGFIDIDKINQDAWPAVLADLSSGEQSIVAVAFGYTRLFQPNKPVTKAQAAVAVATGEAAELVMEELARIEAESLADSAVTAHAALEAQVQKDLNASFEKELELEREKIIAAERSAEEARLKLERLREEREEEKYSLMRDRAAIESERELLSKLRQEVEEQVLALSSNKLEISFERDMVARLRKEAEDEKQLLVQIRSEVEVEKKALSMARAWAEDEAKKARGHAKVLREAREHWEKQGIQVQVDKELEEDNGGVSTWQYSSEVQNQSGKSPLHEILVRAEEIRGKLWLVSNDLKGKMLGVIEKIIHDIGLLITSLQQRAVEAGEKAQELQQDALVVASKAANDMQHITASSVAVVTSSIREGTKRVADECRGGAERISQKFKT
eukprot:Gb_00648 [translate_table: standard]